MSSEFWLSDKQWERLRPLLPNKPRGVPRVDDRRVISGIIHVLRAGCPWRDCPREYGPYTTIYNRFHRWSRRRIWQRILAALVDAGLIGESIAIDSSYVRAHRSAAGGKGGAGRRRSAPRAAVAPPSCI